MAFKQSISVSGLLLQSTPYLGQKKILKILAQEHGLISLFAHKTDLTPFCIAEWVYRPSSQDIYPLQDAKLLDPLFELKQSYDILTAAGQIAKDLLHTQMPHKKAPFDLACAYLKKLPLNPNILVASFRLKLLQYEGLFSIEKESNFTMEEWDQTCSLAFAKSFAQIAMAQAPVQKIAWLFQRSIDRTERDSNP